MKLKMWIGNLDGEREGLVIAPTKKRAREIISTGRSDFENYWCEQAEVDGSLKPETLYTRSMRGRYIAGEPWHVGVCELPRRKS